MTTIEKTTDEVLRARGAAFQGAARTAAARTMISSRSSGINSLQALDLLTRLEQHFHIELPDYEVQGVSDFRTLAERIQSRL